MALLVLALLPARAHAQVSVEVSPLRVDLKTDSGGTYTQAVTLQNHEKEAVKIHARVDDYYLSKDGTPQFQVADGTMPYSAAGWIRVNPVEVTLQPGTESVVRFTVRVPETTAAGGYRAGIVFDLLPGGAEGVVSKGVTFRSRVVTIVYLTIGAPKAVVDLIDVQPLVRPGQPPVIAATLKNTGKVHVRTKGQMVIFDKAGAELRRIPLPDVPVLPESERDVIVPMAGENQPALPAGQYRVEVRIDVGLAQLLVGEASITIEG